MFKTSKIEYSASSNNATPCYSNPINYGSYGKSTTITSPTPASIHPMIFNFARPHKIPCIIKPTSDLYKNCSGYKNINNLCRKCWVQDTSSKTQFKPGFNDVAYY